MLEGASSKIIDIVSSKKFLWFTLILFLIQSSFYALSIAYGLPPDERYHFSLIGFFVQNNFNPNITSQDGYFFLGEITKTPYILYHYLLSPILALLAGFSQEVQVIGLRLINILMALGSLLVLSKIGDLLKLSRFTTNISVFIFASAMMFTFLSGAINYDNLVILLGFLSLFLMIRLIKQREPLDLALWIVVSLAGLLAKVTYTPIFVASALILIVVLRREVISLSIGWIRAFKQHKALNSLIIVMIVGLFSMASYTYVANLATYGSHNPSCVEVHSHEQCLDHAIYRRNLMLNEIDMSGFQPKLSEFGLEWSKQTTSGIFGTLSRNSIQPFKTLVYAMVVLGLTLLSSTVWKFNYRDKVLIYVLAVVVSYLAVLINENFRVYEIRGRLTATQGRYVFPVLPILYMLGFHYLEQIKRSKWVKIGIVVIVIPLLLIGNIPAYLHYSDPSHYSVTGVKIYEVFKGIF